MNPTSENEFRQNLSLPETWATIGFDEATTLIPTTNKKIKQRHYLQDGEIPIIDQGKELIGGYTNDPSMVLETALPVIVFGDHTRIFKYVDFDFAAGADGVKILQPKGFFVPKLYYYFLQCLDLPDKGYARHFQYLRKQVLHLPPFEEQDRIVSTLDQLFSQLDMGVQSLLIVETKIENYQSSILQAACEGRLVSTEAELAKQEGRDYEPASDLLERILAERRKKWEEAEGAKIVDKAKQKAVKATRKATGKPLKKGEKLEPSDWESLPESEYARYLPKDGTWKEKYKEPTAPATDGVSKLPEGWVLASLDMLSSHVTSGSRGWAKYYSDEGSIFVRVGNFDRGSIYLDLEEYVCVNPPESAEALRTRLQLNDLLITITADVGMVAIVDSLIENWIEGYINQHVSLIRPVNQHVIKYIAYALASKDGQKQFEEKEYGATKKGLSLDDVKSLLVPLPPINEQDRIVDEVERRLSVVSEVEDVAEASLLRATRLRQAVLKRAFEARLVRHDPDDEPACVLLDRIRSQWEAQD